LRVVIISVRSSVDSIYKLRFGTVVCNLTKKAQRASAAVAAP